MRRPQATTVSAASTKASEWRAATARAFAAARRLACGAGSSARRGVSSRSAGSTRSGARPIWRRRSSRRGEAEARTSRGGNTPGGAGVAMPPAALLEAEGDTALAEVVGRHLDIDAIAGEHADAVLPHLARGMRQDLVIVVELDAEMRVRQQLHHRAGEFDEILFRHLRPLIVLGFA